MSFSDSHHQIKKDSGKPDSNELQAIIQQAVNAGVEDFIQSRKAKVSVFVEDYFSFQGALKLHRHALGKDLYKAPLNIFWLAPLAVSKVCAFGLDKFGADRMALKLKSLPAGFKTDVQQEINWLIYTELLELPYQQEDRVSTKDALLEAILQNTELANVIDAFLTQIQEKSTNSDFRQKLEINLQVYGDSRAAVAELAGQIITISSNYLAFNKAMPGALTTGSATAAVIAEKIAIAKFWLGPTLGAWYYGVVPVAASGGLIIASTGAIMAGLALLTTFTGIITDPVQAKLGLHQKRLNKFIDSLENELTGQSDSQYKIKEQYISRVFDIVDLLMTAARS